MRSIYNSLAFVALAALTACSSEDGLPGGPSSPKSAVQITANIEGMQTRTTTNTDGSGFFDAGDCWGMYAYTDAANPGELTGYTYKETTLYWEDLSKSAPVTFSAFYPMLDYWSGNLNPTSYMYGFSEDLLFATATKNPGEEVDLTFRHLMHRLVVHLIPGEGMAGVNIRDASISAMGKDGSSTMANDVEVNLLTGEVNMDHVEGLANLTSNRDGVADWIVVPQNMTPGADWLTIGLGGEVWDYSVPEDLNPNEPGNQTCLESGKQLTLKLILNKTTTPSGDPQTEVVLQSAQITPWEDAGRIREDMTVGGQVSGDIDMTNMSVEEARNAILIALNAGVSEFKLTGPASCLYLASTEDDASSPFYGSGVRKVDLSGVTDWQPVMLEEDGSVENVVGIPAYTFVNCYELNEIILPAEVKAIGACAFQDCGDFTINLENITHIGVGAFRWSRIRSMTAPEVIDIRHSAFWDCYNLESISFDKLLTADWDAFGACYNLTTASLPSLKTFGSKVFGNCPLTELRLTAAGAFTNMEGNEISFNEIADEWSPIATTSCNLILNADKQQGGEGSPTVTDDNTWLGQTWQSITFE